MSTKLTRNAYKTMVVALAFFMLAWLWPTGAIATDAHAGETDTAGQGAEISTEFDVVDRESPEEAAPSATANEGGAADQDNPPIDSVPLTEPVADPAAAADPDPATTAPEAEVGNDEFVPNNPDHLPEGYDVPFSGLETVAPATDFGREPRFSLRASRAASDHPTEPGEVKLFKTAEPVEGMLNMWDVTLRVEGKDKKQTSDIVLVIDTSGSMSDRGRMQAARDAASAFVAELLPSDTTRIAVVSFESNVSVKSALTNDPDTLQNAIDGLTANGGTFTQGGLKQAREILKNSEADSKHIVLLSDGEPTYSYEMYDPNEHLQAWGIHQETTKNAPEQAYDYDNRVGVGTGIRWSYYSSWQGWLPPRQVHRYYNHGNSAIAEAGFAKETDVSVWSIGLQMNDVGNSVMQQIASEGNFTDVQDVNQLTPVFQMIAGNISAAVRDPQASDPMGQGFEIPAADVGNITSVPATATPVYENNTIKWNPGTLTVPIADGSDVKYAELKYRVSINDGILNALPDGEGNYPTNGDAQLIYTDADGQQQSSTFPVPKVKPTLYVVKKVLYDEAGAVVSESRDFTVNVTGPGLGNDQSYSRELVVNSSNELGRVITDLRIEGTYTVEEELQTDYSVTYEVDGNLTGNDGKDPATFIATEGSGQTIVIHNRPASGVLTIEKVLKGDATDKAQQLEYSGTYTCTRDAKTISGTWAKTGAGLAALTPNGQTESVEKLLVPVNYECSVTENKVTGADEAYYTSSTLISDPVTIKKDVTANVTVTNTLDKNKGSVVWTKVDGEGAALGGSEWLLTGPSYQDGLSVEDVSSDGNFKVEDLEWGEYTLEEKLAPAGYLLDSAPRTVRIGDVENTNGLDVVIDPIKNTKVTGPSIPLTGGISRDAYIFAGLAAMVAGLAVTGTYAIRRKTD